MKRTYSGINIQYPISRLILSGDKTVETRTYRIPSKYIGVPLLLVETPGVSGEFRSRAIALITFDESFRYANKSEFYEDFKRHLVDRNSPWAWVSSKGKWGWPILNVSPLRTSLPIKKRLGIKFTREIETTL